MLRIKSLMHVLAIIVLSIYLNNCSEETTGSDDGSFQNLAGDWAMISFYYISQADTTLMVDLVKAGYITLNWKVKDDGTYTFTGTSMDVPFSGQSRFLGGDDSIDDEDGGTDILLDGDLRKAILARADIEAINQLLTEREHRSIYHDGERLIREGITTQDELNTACGLAE